MNSTKVKLLVIAIHSFLLSPQVFATVYTDTIMGGITFQDGDSVIVNNEFWGIISTTGEV